MDWFPERVWREYEKREVMALMEEHGIEESARGEAERMCMAALWCVQDSPEARPRMSAVVKMLEGGVEIVAPPKPFNYWFSKTLRLRASVDGAGSASASASASSSSSSTSHGTNSYWYKEPATTTPLMRKYEITVATM